MRVVCISDTHSLHWNVEIPDGDVILFAGDLMNTGQNINEILYFDKWFEQLPHKHKIIVSGNHDIYTQARPDIVRSIFDKYHYLQDSEVIIAGLKFYGSPWTLPFMNWAYMLPPKEIKKKWKLIPKDTDVLITHQPPLRALDFIPGQGHLGCPDLAKRVEKLPNLKLSCFGHLHYEGGQKLKIDKTLFVNASVCNEAYEPINPIVVVDL